MLRRKKWKRILYPALLILLLSEAFLGGAIVHLGMLPGKYLAPILIGLGVLFLLNAMLLCLGMGKGPSKKRKVQRIIGLVIAGLISAVCIYGGITVNKVDRTVAAVTESDTREKLQAIVGVYVLAEDPAVSLRDTTNYPLGIISGIDDKNTERALSLMEAKVSMVLSPIAYKSSVLLIDALYKGDVKMVLMNEAFVSVLSEEIGYEDIESKLRLIEEFEIRVSAGEAASEDRLEKEKNEAAAQEDEKKGNKWSGTSVVNDITKDPFVVYLAGADNYQTTQKDRDFKLIENGRNDVNILMVVNPTTRQILLCHLPRDFYVANPAGNYELDRLTLCGIYGVKNSEAACAYACKTYVNYYARINFSGFVRLIDAIGGITVESSEDFSENFSNGSYHFTVGKNELDGEGALAYARERKSFENGEIARGGHQMQVIQATVDKMTSSGATILLNYSDIMNSIADFFDTDISNDEISSLVKMQLNKGGSWDIKSYNLGGTAIKAETFTNPGTLKFLYEPKENQVEHFRELVDKMFAGEKLTAADVVVPD